MAVRYLAVALLMALEFPIQLTYEIPYVVQVSDGQQTQSGWSNAYPGIKWRFWDQGEEGWQV